MGLHARERGKDPGPPRHGPVIRMVSAAALVVVLVVGVLAGAATAQGTCGPLVGVPCTGGQCCRHVPPCRPLHPASTHDQGACLSARALHNDWLLYHCEYELPQHVCSGRSQLSAFAVGAGTFWWQLLNWLHTPSSLSLVCLQLRWLLREHDKPLHTIQLPEGLGCL